LCVKDNGTFEIIQEKANVVRQIFAWLLESRGLTWITKELNQTGVPTIGGRNGKYKKSTQWNKSYVTLIAHNRAVIGEARPGRWDGKARRAVPTGQVWPGFYPAIISVPDFHKVQGLLRQRCTEGKKGLRWLGGRKGKDIANLFSGLVWDARDHAKMRLVDKGKPKGAQKMLVSVGACQGHKGSVYIGFPYQSFETAFLRLVSELRAEDILPREAGAIADEIEGLEAQLADQDRRIARIKAEMENNPDLDLLLDTVGKLSASRKATAKRLDEVRSKQSNGERGNLADAQSLVELLEEAKPEERESLRLRLQSRLRQLVKEIWMLTVKLGRYGRVAFVQVIFADGEHRRSLVMGGQEQGKEKLTFEKKIRDTDLDLRRPGNVKWLEADLFGLGGEKRGDRRPTG
jgi:hypothetical protein